MLKQIFNLRKVIALVICLAGSIAIYAQDIILMRNGNNIQAIVQETGVADVKYKRFDNQNGQTYILKKAEVSMIKYQNGREVYYETTASASTSTQQQTQTYTQQQVQTQWQTPTAANRQSNSYRSSINSQQQPPVLRYTFGKQINPNGLNKDPFLAGVFSFFIPGVGQFYNGDVGGGFLFLGCDILFSSIYQSAIWTNSYGDVYVNVPQFTIGITGALVVEIWSIVNAAQGANKVNTARGYRLSDNTYLKIQPTIIPQNNFQPSREYAYGMNISLNF